MGAGCSQDTAKEVQTHVTTVLRALLKARGDPECGSLLYELTAVTPVSITSLVTLSALWTKYRAFDTHGMGWDYADSDSDGDADGAGDSSCVPEEILQWFPRTVAPMMPLDDSGISKATLKLSRPAAEGAPRLCISWTSDVVCAGAITVEFNWAHLAYLSARWVQAPSEGGGAGGAGGGAGGSAGGAATPMFMFKDPDEGCAYRPGGPPPPPDFTFPDDDSDVAATAFRLLTPSFTFDDDTDAYKIVTLPSKAAVYMSSEYASGGEAVGDAAPPTSSHTAMPAVFMVPQRPTPETPGGGNVVFLVPTRLVVLPDGTTQCLQHVWCHLPVMAVIKWLRGAVHVIEQEAKEAAELEEAAARNAAKLAAKTKLALPCVPLTAAGLFNKSAVLEVLQTKTPRCWACDRADAKTFCSKCKFAWYCNAECQRQHWKKHRTMCK
jgi:hypothetical protein